MVFYNETTFFSSLEQHLIQSEKENLIEMIILGDLNFDMQDPCDSRKLTDFNAAHGFINTIKAPTRLNPSSGKETLLDVILTSSPSSCLSSTVIPYSRSDHRLIISVFNFKSAKYKFCKIPSRCLNDKSMEKVKIEIKKQLSLYDFKILINTDIYITKYTF